MTQHAKPIRAYRLTLELGADTAHDMATALISLADRIERIQALCGHADKSTTEKYIKARWRESLAPNVVKMK